MNALTMENLSKTYPNKSSREDFPYSSPRPHAAKQLSSTCGLVHTKKAVDSVNLCLKPGEVFGFLGPNGAGKTTTVKLLNGMLAPTQGCCHVFGLDPATHPEKVHALSGVVTEHAQMYDSLSGLDNLIFYGALFGLDAAESRKRSLDLLKQLDLIAAKDLKLSAYSTGMRQRLSLARALIHCPKLLFLDEPTSGLDPESAQSVHTMIRQLAVEQGCTIFLCTHQLRYAQEICTRYGLMAEGRLLAEGTLEDLRTKICSGITMKVKASGLPADLMDRLLRQNGHLYEIPVQSEEDIPRLIRQIVDAGENIYQVQADFPTLEDIYFTLTNAKETS